MIAVIIGCVATTCATDARGPNFTGRIQNGLAPYGSYQPQQMGFSGQMKTGNNFQNYPQDQMSGAMTQGSNRGSNFYAGQQQPMAPNQMMSNRNPGMQGEQMMGGQPMENYQGAPVMGGEQMMGNMQAGYQGNPGMANEQAMGNPQMGFQAGNEQMNPMNPMGAMNPNGFGGQGGMVQPGMNPQQGMGMNQGGFQPQGGNFGGNQQNPQMFNEEQEERMGGDRGMEPATFGANAAF